MLARAAAELAPHDVAFYLRDLAAAFHSYYAAERFLVDDPSWLARAWRCWRPRARCCATRWRCSASAPRRRWSAASPELRRAPTWRMKSQRGGFAVGLIVGLLVGLVLALGVALYVTKVPVPFVNKVPQRTRRAGCGRGRAQQELGPECAAERQGGATRRGAGQRPCRRIGDDRERHAGTPPPGLNAVATPTTAPLRRPAGNRRRRPRRKALKPGADPFTYFAQAGAYSRAEDAQAQRAKLALIGLDAKIVEREQAGRTVYRVRLGPFDKRPDAEAMLERLNSASVESSLVRVERQ